MHWAWQEAIQCRGYCLHNHQWQLPFSTTWLLYSAVDIGLQLLGRSVADGHMHTFYLPVDNV